MSITTNLLINFFRQNYDDLPDLDSDSDSDEDEEEDEDAAAAAAAATATFKESEHICPSNRETGNVALR